jgi:hypothetical protein
MGVTPATGRRMVPDGVSERVVDIGHGGTSVPGPPWVGSPALVWMAGGGLQAGGAFMEMTALAMLGPLADVELADRAMVAHHAGPDFAALALFGGQGRVLFLAHGMLLFVDGGEISKAVSDSGIL